MMNIYKEKGYTSHDVVAKLRGIVKQKKIGHTGTLDPAAEGVLPVCLGKGTKLCDMLTDTDKTYRAVMRLGIVTDTQDMSGKVLAQQEIGSEITEEKIREAAISFEGNYSQIPPMYSALKRNGKKLYELARAGVEVKREPRNVTIYKMEVEKISPPFVTMTVSCSKGTYIRTLCHDIGEKLGTGGCMESLIRTKAGVFEIKDSITLSEVEELFQKGQLERVIHKVDSMFLQYPEISILEKYEKFLYNGNPFRRDQVKDGDKLEVQSGSLFRVYGLGHTFAGIYRLEENGLFRVVKFFME